MLIVIYLCPRFGNRSKAQEVRPIRRIHHFGFGHRQVQGIARAAGAGEIFVQRVALVASGGPFGHDEDVPDQRRRV